MANPFFSLPCSTVPVSGHAGPCKPSCGCEGEEYAPRPGTCGTEVGQYFWHRFQLSMLS